MKPEFESLIPEIKADDAVSPSRNTFFRNWQGEKFSWKGVDVFARNYGAWIHSLPAGQAHPKLLDHFFDEFARVYEQEGRLARQQLRTRYPLLPDTVNLIDEKGMLWHRQFGSRIHSEAEVAGRRFATAIQTYPMVQALYEGAKLYEDRWPNAGSFRDACAYFHAHLDVGENAAQQAALEEISSHEWPIDEVRTGVQRQLDAIYRFWYEMYYAGLPTISTTFIAY